jgi:hypothetical protein
MQFFEVSKVRDARSLTWVSSHLSEAFAVKHLKLCPLIRRLTEVGPKVEFISYFDFCRFTHLVFLWLRGHE